MGRCQRTCEICLANNRCSFAAKVGLGWARLSALVTLVGAGPGDPSLITLAGVVALGRARVVICDALEHRALVADCAADAELIDRASAPYLAWSKTQCVELAARRALAGVEVCWLVGGALAADALARSLAALGVRAELVGFDSALLALHSLNVAVTRPRAQQRTLATLLRAHGASSWDFSAIEVRPNRDEAPLRAAIDGIGSASVVAFTSANGVDAFFSALGVGGKDARALAGVLVASIGDATSERLREYGIVADLRSRESVGESLAERILERLGSHACGARVTVVRAVRGRASLVDALRAAGVEVQLVPAYDTAPSERLSGLRAALEQGAIDVVTFASGSAIDAVLAALGDDALQLLSPVTIATVGPVTTAHARSASLAVHVEADSPSDASLVRALCEHFTWVRGR